jgi:Fic family protein
VLGSEQSDRKDVSASVREILNYIQVAEEAFEWPVERPIASSFLAGLQKLLVEGTSGDHSDAGRLRDRQVFIGVQDAPIEHARFVPAPPGDQLAVGVEQLVSWINDPPSNMPSVVAAGLAHYQFETLHPFSDGNGRIGRLLIVMQLLRQRALQHPILVVSPWFEERRTVYQDALLQLSCDGNWDDWITFFASGLESAALRTLALIEGLLTWQKETVRIVRESGTKGVAERVAGELIGTPLLTAGRVARDHGVTHQAAMNALRRLAELGVITEGTTSTPRLFFARDVVRMLSGSSPS